MNDLTKALFHEQRWAFFGALSIALKHNKQKTKKPPFGDLQTPRKKTVRFAVVQEKKGKRVVPARSVFHRGRERTISALTCDLDQRGSRGTVFSTLFSQASPSCLRTKLSFLTRARSPLPCHFFFLFFFFFFFFSFFSFLLFFFFFVFFGLSAWGATIPPGTLSQLMARRFGLVVHLWSGRTHNADVRRCRCRWRRTRISPLRFAASR